MLGPSVSGSMFEDYDTSMIDTDRSQVVADAVVSYNSNASVHVDWTGDLPGNNSDSDAGSNDGDGFATMRMASGAKYSGQIKRGRMSGVGAMKWPDGMEIIGEWVNNSITGTAHVSYREGPDGPTYDGQLKRGVRSGVGCFVHGKTQYHGEWLKGEKHGLGVEHREGWGVYVGQWSSGKRHGWGAMYFPNGDRYEGHWREGKADGYGTMLWVLARDKKMDPEEKQRILKMDTYATAVEAARKCVFNVGSVFSADCGTFTPSERTNNDLFERYTGEWRAGKPHGEGAYEWTRPMEGLQAAKAVMPKMMLSAVTKLKTGIKQAPTPTPYNGPNVYSGSFVEGKKHGHGLLYTSDGLIVEGTWVDDAKHGKGVVLYPDGHAKEYKADHDKMSMLPHSQFDDAKDGPIPTDSFAIDIADLTPSKRDLGQVLGVVRKHKKHLKLLFSVYSKIHSPAVLTEASEPETMMSAARSPTSENADDVRESPSGVSVGTEASLNDSFVVLQSDYGAYLTSMERGNNTTAFQYLMTGTSTAAVQIAEKALKHANDARSRVSEFYKQKDSVVKHSTNNITAALAGASPKMIFEPPSHRPSMASEGGRGRRHSQSAVFRRPQSGGNAAQLRIQSYHKLKSTEVEGQSEGSRRSSLSGVSSRRSSLTASQQSRRSSMRTSISEGMEDRETMLDLMKRGGGGGRSPGAVSPLSASIERQFDDDDVKKPRPKTAAINVNLNIGPTPPNTASLEGLKPLQPLPPPPDAVVRKPAHTSLNVSQMVEMLHDAQLLSLFFQPAQATNLILWAVMKRDAENVKHAHKGAAHREAELPSPAEYTQRPMLFHTFVEALVRIADYRSAFTFPFMSSGFQLKASLSERLGYMMESFINPLAMSIAALNGTEHCNKYVPRLRKDQTVNNTVEEHRKQALRAVKDTKRPGGVPRLSGAPSLSATLANLDPEFFNATHSPSNGEEGAATATHNANPRGSVASELPVVQVGSGSSVGGVSHPSGGDDAETSFSGDQSIMSSATGQVDVSREPLRGPAENSSRQKCQLEVVTVAPTPGGMGSVTRIHEGILQTIADKETFCGVLPHDLRLKRHGHWRARWNKANTFGPYAPKMLIRYSPISDAINAYLPQLRELFAQYSEPSPSIMEGVSGVLTFVGRPPCAPVRVMPVPSFIRICIGAGLIAADNNDGIMRLANSPEGQQAGRSSRLAAMKEISLPDAVRHLFYFIFDTHVDEMATATTAEIVHDSLTPDTGIPEAVLKIICAHNKEFATAVRLLFLGNERRKNIHDQFVSVAQRQRCALTASDSLTTGLALTFGQFTEALLLIAALVGPQWTLEESVAKVAAVITTFNGALEPLLCPKKVTLLPSTETMRQSKLMKFVEPPEEDPKGKKKKK